MIWVAAGAGSRPRRSQARRSTSGSVAEYVPTAPESLPTRTPSIARCRRSPRAIELERPDGELQPERGRLGVDSMCAPDRQRVAVLLCPRDDAGQRALELVEQEPPGGLQLERQRRVQDIRGGQPVVEPAPDRDPAARLPRRQTPRRRAASPPRSPPPARASGNRTLPNLRRRVGRNHPDRGPRLEGGELDFEPAGEPSLVRPDAGHGRPRVPGDHRFDSRGGS